MRITTLCNKYKTIHYINSKKDKLVLNYYAFE